MGASKLDLFSLLAQQGIRRGAGVMSDTEKIGQLRRKPTFWDSLMVGGLGAIDPSLSSQYLDTKLNRQDEALQRQERREAITEINNAVNLQTAGAQSAINKQLSIEQQNLASTMAVSGGIRTGNYQRKVGELNRQGVEDVARVAQQGALQGKMIELGYTQDVQNFNLELAKLESAKSSGDAQMAGAIGENLAPMLYDMFFKGGGQGEIPVSDAEFGPELPVSRPITLDNMSPPSSSPTLDHIRNLYKPKPKSSAGMFAPTTDNTDPISILWSS